VGQNPVRVERKDASGLKTADDGLAEVLLQVKVVL